MVRESNRPDIIIFLVVGFPGPHSPFDALRDLIRDKAVQSVASHLKDRLRDTLMRTQINDAAEYRSLFTRVGASDQRGSLGDYLRARFEEEHYS